MENFKIAKDIDYQYYKTTMEKVEKKEAPKPNIQLEAVEQLTKVNVNLVQQIQQLSADMDNLKDRVAQVASRLGL